MLTLRAALATGAFAFAASAAALTANFDSLTEGSFAQTIADGGITFHDYDARFPGSPPPNFMCIEDASGDLGSDPNFSSPNTLGFFGYSPGPGTAFSRCGLLWFDAPTQGASASLDIWVVSSTNNIITMEAYLSGAVVATDVVNLNFGGFYQHFTMSASGTMFDSVRIVGTGADNEGCFFAVVDNVNWEPVPEPRTVVTLALGLVVALSFRRHIR